MTDTKKALEMAIEQIKWAEHLHDWHDGLLDAIKVCKEALEQPASKNIRDSFNEMLEDKVSYYKNKQSAQKPVALIRHENGNFSPAPSIAQEPVAWLRLWVDGDLEVVPNTLEGAFPVYTHPAPSCSCKDKK